MLLTTGYLEESFRKFNEEYFEGKLPLPRISLSRSRTRLGSMSCRRRLTLRGYRMSDFTIRVSTYYDMSERQICNILLHEMIHYYIAYNGLRDSSPHGNVFKRMMNNINKRYGWEISVSSSAAGMKRNVEVKDKEYLVLLLRTSDGTRFVSVVNPAYSSSLERRIRHVSDVVWHEWFTSRDAFFAEMPSVRSLRGRKISEEKLGELLPNLKKL